MTKREPNVANVWWLPGETLHCLQCAGDIQPVRMDNERLVALLGAEPHTPLDQAIEQTLEGMGCLDGGRTGGHAHARTTWA